MFESIRIIESIQEVNKGQDEDKGQIQEWLEVGQAVAQEILQANPTDQAARLMTGIFYVYGGDYKRGTKILTKLLGMSLNPGFHFRRSNITVIDAAFRILITIFSYFLK